MRGTMALVSFLNLNEYPPPQIFLLMTLGPMIMARRTGCSNRQTLVITHSRHRRSGDSRSLASVWCGYSS